MAVPSAAAATAGSPGGTVECAEVADATIELQCEPSDVDAGAVGVSSWVTSPEGDTLCVLP